MSQDKEREAWRDLALQFDGHRMQALGWLRLIAKELPKNPDWAGLYHFLASPPLSGEAVLAERLAALASQQAGKGEPLTAEALGIAMTNSYYDAASFIAGVRFAERAHGIHSRGEGEKA